MSTSIRSLCMAAAATALAATTALAGDEGRRIEAKSPAGRGGYRLAAQLAIGGPEAAPEAQFYEKTGQVDVGADARGRIYVLDNGGPRVQVFDSSGRFLHGFGREGEGPGEMKMPARMAVSADGHVALFDVALNRLSIHDATGKLVRDQVPPQPVRDLAFTKQGALVCSFHGPAGDAVEAFAADGRSLWAYRPDGSIQTGGRMMVLEVGAETIGSRLEIDPQGGVLLGGRDAYAVRRMREGRIEETWTRPYERQARAPLPRPRDGEGGEGGAVFVVRREMTAGPGGGGSGGGGQTRVTTSSDAQSETHTFSPDELEKMMPKHSPDIRGLLAWPDGRVWVVTSTNDGDTMLVDEWTNGEYRKRFAIPSTWSRLRVGADGRLYGVTRDRDEYPIVQRIDVAPES